MPRETAPIATQTKPPGEHRIAPQPTTAEKKRNQRENRRLREIRKKVDTINGLENSISELTDDELRETTNIFKEFLKEGKSFDDILPEAFAVVREVSKRVLHMRQYDVQIMGAIALHEGNIAEMETGEGKTLTAVMTAYLHALDPNSTGVHVVTVNDYLTERDAEWMGPIYEFLGLTVGVILPNRPAEEHQKAYKCDITYGTAHEFGFDYLRDNMALSTEEKVQRGYSFAIIDEVDSILIDEARDPLKITGKTEGEDVQLYIDFARLVEEMDIKSDHYEVDEATRNAWVNEEGISFAEQKLGIDNLYMIENTSLVGHLLNAIKAKTLYKKNKDYIVEDGQIVIVDEFTGRPLYGRRYNEGIHQAIEAKEGVKIKTENEMLATISLQNYFRLYRNLSGMTGTASSEGSEFNKVYNMQVVPIPTHNPGKRKDHPDVAYRSKKEKFDAVIKDIINRHKKGQPILVGTISIEDSEYLSELLKKYGISHNVLNAKHLAEEARIVAQAGRKYTVTIATNMAGRGTDIQLGGNPEFMAEQELKDIGLTKESDLPIYQSQYKERYEEALQRYKAQTDSEKAEVIELGGLYVIGTEKHVSKRIDKQLRGRSGRQGDPGETRFYLSLEDDLMKRLPSAQIEAIKKRSSTPDNTPITSRFVNRQIRNTQSQIEQKDAETRKNVLKYDSVLQAQRNIIYKDRDRILESENIRGYIDNMIRDVINDHVLYATPEGSPKNWNLERLWETLSAIHPPGLSIDQAIFSATGGDLSRLTSKSLGDILISNYIRTYDERVKDIDTKMGEGTATKIERRILSSVLDYKWRMHLIDMEDLQGGVRLRAYAREDPFVSYQREGHDMFSTMQEELREEAVSFLFNVEIRAKPSKSTSTP